MTNHKIIIFNPKSANSKHRIPNSILQVGASVHGKYNYVFIDGNLEQDPWQTIANYLKTGEFKYFGSTVMPGPQLLQAIPFTKKIKTLFPDIITIWGGYFASNQYKVSLESGYVDYIVNGPGDQTFPELINTLESNRKEDTIHIKNLIFKNNNGEIIKTATEALLDQDSLPKFPYEYLNTFYPVKNYLAKTFMGSKTLSYHSSMGCPFSCSFCAVVPIYNARWKGMSAARIYEDVKYFKEKYQIDAVEFHDNNFFTSKKRVLEFSELIKNDNINYWGEGRIDTLNMYSDDELKFMRKAGCRMIFLGAETGNDKILKQMNKGGTQTGQMIKDFVLRMKNADIIPELSFVLGLPAATEKEVYDQILWDINFIKEIKEINPKAEIIIYLYSPVPTEGSELYQQIIDAGFSFPSTLEDWISPSWENFDLRKNPLTPWLKPYMIDTIKNFETVLNGYYPTASDFRIKGWKKRLLQLPSSIRYKTGIYNYPYEIKLMHKIWKYRQPEIEGFYSE
ncbi:B12-binding domain-containing radical SAM protein [Flavobacterium sp. NRK F10]|uniref:B12-binding domain-containing radical SAM protein n=1 Tax=Flavobacterium sp. NRK F10 TaxID=2954931 RepID=UPI002090ECB0|nr:radical SAM protein [Flavobacterium sp. NRK F10]MCO6175107.1 B12-binding domain-containing radical SAM protein [Flavobacterium sp. NRK F10]